MAPSRPVPWGLVAAAVGAGAVLTGVVVWRAQVAALTQEASQTQSALKRLTVGGQIPPTEEVMRYLTGRQEALERRYAALQESVAVPPLPAGAATDPQLYFQERLHKVQRTLERLALARGMPVPEQLGFPKELPPAETVPRLLAQLDLIQESAEVILDQGVAAVDAVKLEDPVVVAMEQEQAVVTRLPIRVRLTASLPTLMKTMGALTRTTPLIDVTGLRIAAAEATETLDVDLQLSRYLVRMPPVSATAATEPTLPPRPSGSARPKADAAGRSGAAPRR